MTDQAARAAAFLELHRPGRPLLLPNPWDAGSAKLLASLGFEALATTSSGFAATLGRLDGWVTREEALVHAAAIVAATELPVSADLENGFAETPDGVAETAAGAVAAGLAGFSIEDFTGDDDDPIYPIEVAVERVAAAAAAAHSGPAHVVLTARCENHIHDRPDLPDTIARLQAYERAGADVLYAPGLATAERDHRGDRGGVAARQRARPPRRPAGRRAGGARRQPRVGGRRVRLRRARRPARRGS